MLLDSESPKYLGNEEGLLNIELMRKLYHVIAFNLAKSRAAQDGNKYAKEHYPTQTKNIGAREKHTSERPQFKDI